MMAVTSAGLYAIYLHRAPNTNLANVIYCLYRSDSLHDAKPPASTLILQT